MRTVAWGLIISGVGLEFFWLEYILPTIGMLLLYSGCRRLRQGSEWFRRAWILSMVEMGLQALDLVMAATPLLEGNLIFTVLYLVACLIPRLLLLWNLHKAVEEVYGRFHMIPGRRPFRVLLIWSVLFSIGLVPLVYILTLLGFLGVLALLAAVVWYIAILVSLYQLGGEMDALPQGYLPGPQRFGDGWVSTGYLAACLALVLVACAFGNHLWLRAQPMADRTGGETRQQLLVLGMPAHILDDLSDETVELIGAPIYLETDTCYFPLKDLKDPSARQAQPEEPYLKATAVFIEQQDQRVTVVEHFSFAGVNPVWQSGITVTGSYQSHWPDELGGQLLYEKGGQTYEAPIPRLGSGAPANEANTIDFFSMGVDRPMRISGAMNFPFQAEGGRGYVFYTVQLLNMSYCGDHWVNYSYQDTPIRFPYSRPEESASYSYPHGAEFQTIKLKEWFLEGA